MSVEVALMLHVNKFMFFPAYSDVSRLVLCFRNFLFAPSDTNSYEFSTFTGIRDAFAEYLKARSFASDRENEARVAVEQQISMVTLAIQSAYSILSEDEYF